MVICLNHFVLIDVCSVDLLVAWLRMSASFQGYSLREKHLWEHFGQTDKIALITVNVSKTFKRIRPFSDQWTWRGDCGRQDGNSNGVKWVRPNFKAVTVTVIFGKSILKNNKTAGNNFDLNGKVAMPTDIGPASLQKCVGDFCCIIAKTP